MSLIFQVGDLLKKDIGETNEFDVKEAIPDFDPKLKILSPLAGLITLSHIDDGIMAQLTGDISVEIACARCANNFKIDFSLDFMQEYWVLGIVKEDVDTPRISEKNEIDLLPRIQQEILVRIPVKPLCQDLCKGVCPSCGQNLNIKACPCPPEIEKPESPFAGLKEKIK